MANPVPQACSSPNRALWRSLTQLQAENSNLKVHIQQLERNSVTLGSPIGSSKFIKMELENIKMELEKERAELASITAQLADSQEQLAAAGVQLQHAVDMRGSFQQQVTELEAQLQETRLKADGAFAQQQLLQEDVARLATERNALRQQVLQGHADAEAAQAQGKELTAQLEGARTELKAADLRLRSAASTEAALRSCQEQLQEYSARLQAKDERVAAARAAQAEARTELEAMRVKHMAVVAGLEATQHQQREVIAELEQQLASFQRASREQGTGASSPTASLGVQSDGADSEAVHLALNMPSVPCGLQSATVYNDCVMIESPRAEPGAVEEEQERLRGQVCSLQDKLEALQQAHEALLGDYSAVVGELAARNAEVTLARLSPESGQLKNQVQSLQDQVVSLQQELFRAAHLQLEEGLAALPRDGKKLKRSFTRAASSLGQKAMGMLQRQKSLSPSLDDCSRGTSFSESIASRSNSVSPYAASLAPRDGSMRAAHVEAELLHLRQQLHEKEVATAALEQRLAGDQLQLEQLQDAIMRQGDDLQEQLAAAHDALARQQAELDVATRAAQQLMEVQSVPTLEVYVPGPNHAKCRETIAELFKQVWKERMARQKAEFDLEQHQQSQSRRRTLSEPLDEAVLGRLEEEALAADHFARELRKARDHQCMLQQRLEALQQQIAKQSTLLESTGGRPSPSRTQGSVRASKEAITQQNQLKAAEDLRQEAEGKLVAVKKQLAQLRRRDRELNSVLAQAAEWRKEAENRHEQAVEGWRRRWEKERTTAHRMEGRLRATAIAQHELLDGLEVLQTLLWRKSGLVEANQGGTPRRGRLAHTIDVSISREALKQVTRLLRTATTHLQILSPQQSDCIGRAELGSPRGRQHLALSVTAGEGAGDCEATHPLWDNQSAERLSDPVEPVSPRLDIMQELSSVSGEVYGQQVPEGASCVDELQTILDTASEGPAAESWTALGSSRQAAACVGSDSHQHSAPGPATVPAKAAEDCSSLRRGSSSLDLDLLEGSTGSQADTAASSISQGSDTILAFTGKGFISQEQQSNPATSDLRMAPLHRPCTGKAPTTLASSSRIPAHSAASQGKAPAPAHSAPSSSPRMKSLGGFISSSLRRMGVPCKTASTLSGASTPKPAPWSTRRSIPGNADMPGSAASSKAPPKTSTPLKPRKIWL